MNQPSPLTFNYNRDTLVRRPQTVWDSGAELRYGHWEPLLDGVAALIGVVGTQ